MRREIGCASDQGDDNDRGDHHEHRHSHEAEPRRCHADLPLPLQLTLREHPDRQEGSRADQPAPGTTGSGDDDAGRGHNEQTHHKRGWSHKVSF